MVQLSRTVRFCLNSPHPPGGAPVPNGESPAPVYRHQPPRHNGFSAWPPMHGLGRYYEMHVKCQGQVDPVTGYFINISQIDLAVHQHALPVFYNTLDHCASDAAVPMGHLLRSLIDAMQPPLADTVCELTLQLTPFYDLSIRRPELEHVYIRQQYEFAASHRLHVPTISDERNREIFGKCNHESGHGHNYRVVVTVRVPIGPDGHVRRLQDLDAVVDTHAIQHLDHKHLNLDVPQFADRNPSVENIARAIYQMIQGPINDMGDQLIDVSVWETSKTVCTYSGEDPARNPHPSPLAVTTTP